MSELLALYTNADGLVVCVGSDGIIRERAMKLTLVGSKLSYPRVRFQEWHPK